MTDSLGGREDFQAAANTAPVPRDRRVVTVLFADLVRSTELISGMDPETAASVLIPAVNGMSKAIQRCGGTITHTMGDGLMAVFGVPTVQEDHAIRAAHAALAIQAEIGALTTAMKSPWANEIKVRVGLNSGPVVVATMSDGGHVSYAALGPTTHLASRIEAAALPGSIALSEYTARRIQPAFECQPLGTKTLKGFSKPQAIFQLIGPIDGRRAKSLPNGEAVTTPLIGRVRELGEIQERFEALARCEGSLVLIMGEPGIGKTRVIQEARYRLTQDVTWLEGHSLSFGQRLSYWPFTEMLKPWLGIHVAQDLQTNWRCIEQKVLGLMGDEGGDILPYLATLLGVELTEPYLERVRYLDAENLGAQVMRAVWRLIERMAREKPVVMVIDDLHWIDGSSAALLEHLLPLAGQFPIFFCFTGRQEGEVPARLKRVGEAVPGLYVTELVLVPLSVEDSQNLIASIIGDNERTSRLRDLVLYKAEGNPFFAEELVRTLIHSNVLIHTHHGWETNDQDVKLPDKVQDVIMARVDRLDERLKRVLGIAAVIGRSFFYRVLRAVTEAGDELDERLSKLEAFNVIDELKSAPELAYLFRHALTQEAVYESVLIGRRKSIHERVGECIELIYGERVGEVSSVLAFHYTRAENWEKALKFLLEAAEQSVRIAADDEALLHYQAAVSAYGHVFGERWDKGQRAHIERRLGEIYFRRGSHGQALAHLSNVLSIYGESLPTSKFGVQVAIGRELLIQCSRRLFSGLLHKELRASPDPGEETLTKAFEAFAWTVSMRDHSRLVAVCLKTLNVSERLALAEAVSKASAGFGLGLDCLGWNRLATFYHRRGLRIAEELGNPSAIGLACNLRGIHDFITGHWIEATASLDRGRDFLNRAGDLSGWSNASGMKCEILNEQGRFDQVLTIANEMMKVGRESAFQTAYRWGITQKAKALRRMGRKECEAALQEASTLSLRTSDIMNLGLIQGELAYHQIHDGRCDDARRTLEQYRLAVNTNPVMTFTAIHPQFGLALLEIVDVERSKTRDATKTKRMLRACRNAHRMSRTFRNGIPMSARLLGAAEWLMDHPQQAERWWRLSEATAEHLRAPYQRALTMIERGRRKGSTEDLDNGRSLLGGLGMESLGVERVPLL
jgi:class 3 adenylate cyclase/tetratricopeptide (TPR) repeat protein